MFGLKRKLQLLVLLFMLLGLNNAHATIILGTGPISEPPQEVRVGERFDITINLINDFSNLSPIFSWSLDFLYNPTIFRFEAVNFGNMGDNGFATIEAYSTQTLVGFEPWEFISMHQSTNVDGTNLAPKNGSFDLATLTFTAISVSTATSMNFDKDWEFLTKELDPDTGMEIGISNANRLIETFTEASIANTVFAEKFIVVSEPSAVSEPSVLNLILSGLLAFFLFASIPRTDKWRGCL